MATVTFTFGPKTKSFTVSPAGVARFMDWAAAAYPTVPNPAYVDPETTSTVSPTIPNPDPVISVIDGLWAGVRNNVRGYEKQQGVAAVPDPTDVT